MWDFPWDLPESTVLSMVVSPRASLSTRHQAIMLESRNAHKRGDSQVLAYASSDLLAYLSAKIERMNIKTTYYFLTGKKLEVNFIVIC